MAISWTDQQLQAITTKGSNILVAAAAGSGKTAVLVERIIRRICDAENPLSVDRLLVLTFTEAAASEMKRKISDAIQLKIKEQPENIRLRDQGLLIHSAHISTIHAFCNSIIKNNIHYTNLPTDYSLIEESENEILRAQALDTVLERYYSRIDKKKDFRNLALGYGGIKTDANLRGTILSLHNFVRSLAYPERWLKEAVDQYKIVAKSGNINGTIWEKLILEICYDQILTAKNGMDAIMEIVESEIPHDHKYYDYYNRVNSDFLTAYLDLLKQSTTYDELISRHNAFDLGKTPVKKGLDEEVVTRLNILKKELVKAPLDRISQILLLADDQNIEKIIKCSGRIETLKQLVRQTDRLHRSLKRERSALDFGDLEHEMIRLISTGNGAPTSVALKLRERFDEILVDEYQDTNNIQDTMFNLLSRGDNVFMVGDLKQSIYRFRNADPSIFAEKYRRYLKGDGGVCIQLFKNFRSRPQVIDTVNGIFSSIMTMQTGDLDYTQEEYLINGADYKDACGDFTTEILLTDTDKDHYNEDSDYQEYSSYQLSALTVAKRINSLVNNKELLIKDSITNQPRPLRLGDITILVRNKSKVYELEEVLNSYNIPTASDTGSSYLDTVEVMTVLSFLQIIDNPRQDIPLIAVLRSGIFDFSPDELAEIRQDKRRDFYEDLVALRATNKKVAHFLDILDDFRLNLPHTGVDSLIWQICHNLHYFSIVGGMENGDIRQANLNLLYERSTEFEQGHLNGLLNFMAYIENIRKSGQDMVSTKELYDTDNTINIMTIHKSKGLEFPVVILYGIEQYFNERDTSNPVIWHERAGIAIDYVDTKNRVKYKTLSKMLVSSKMVRDSRAEEMRLLYVALTRAKEKLILATTIGSTRNNWKKASFDHKKKVLSGFIGDLACMKDWVLSSVMPHPDSLILREIAERYDILPDTTLDYRLKVTLVNHQNEPDFNSDFKWTTTSADLKNTDGNTDIQAQLNYRYPHQQLGLTPFKMSVSEVKRRLMPEDNYTPQIPSLNTVLLTNEAEIGAAEKGTITHYILQHLDFSLTNSLSEIEEQISSMVKNSIITQRQANAVSAPNIYNYFCSELGQRLKNATKVYREFDFYTEIPASLINSELSGADADYPVLLQGIADCIFFEGDKLILIDYKTDNITKNLAPLRAKNYLVQIEHYSKALEKIFEQPVAERFLHFLHCGETIKI